MLENEISTQSEKRGRFIIQEIDEENDQATKNNYYSEKNININNCLNTKRPKHSSIMDSKIIHTTRTDSMFSNIVFSTLVYDENRRDWIDFDQPWKDFSKFHSDVLEDDMEKIFHYIDKKIDESDFFNSNINNSQSQLNCIKLRNDDKFKLASDYDINVEFECKNSLSARVKSEEVKISRDANKSNSSLNKQTKNINYSENQRESKDQLQSSFYGPSIFSPAISPINGCSKFIKFEYINDVKNSLRKKALTKSDSKRGKRKSNNFKIIKNDQFTILPLSRRGKRRVIMQMESQIQIASLEINRNNRKDNICSICKSKITDS